MKDLPESGESSTWKDNPKYFRRQRCGRRRMRAPMACVARQVKNASRVRQVLRGEENPGSHPKEFRMQPRHRAMTASTV
jgi:hypothetical protein